MAVCGPAGPPIARIKIQSSYTEDIHINGHSSIFGSYYCPERSKWGYKCCKIIDRKAACPHRKADDTFLEGSSSEEDSLFDSDSDEEPRIKDLDEFREMRKREDCADAEEFVAGVIQYCLCFWRDHKNQVLNFSHMTNGADLVQVFKSAKMFDETMTRMANFVWLLEKRRVSDDTVGKLEKVCSLVLEREYAAAHSAYVDLVIGGAQWILDVPALVAEDKSDGPKIIGAKAEQMNKTKGAGLLDCDTMKGYMTTIKRLMALQQAINPNPDPSKNSG